MPQFGIFARGTQAHHFLEFDLRAGVTSDQAVASFRRLRTPDVSAGGVNVVVAFGAATRAVRDVAQLGAEQAGFTYRDGRDMTGFVDGTASPPSHRSVVVARGPP